ncbi:uncharacterized protein BJ171DRAFT_516763 [Polychytrium aggregatum]|uniref:uncharacterized protein n=1 Tax=Polychytrium aggregatum TaxID=110093 RepID=UPI0022FE4421|nr:uncharacterized protein BJ171DRAFT_516763 [Polychytrium aggregatum]KAI9201873.1 hypothetical protein BJ171DRAFT_516763 [Polychytrium aggregatum]
MSSLAKRKMTTVSRSAQRQNPPQQLGAVLPQPARLDAPLPQVPSEAETAEQFEKNVFQAALRCAISPLLETSAKKPEVPIVAAPVPAPSTADDMSALYSDFQDFLSLGSTAPAAPTVLCQIIGESLIMDPRVISELTQGLETKAKIFSQISNRPNLAVFCGTVERLRPMLHNKSLVTMLGDLLRLLELIATMADKSISEPNEEKRDELLLETVRLFVAQIKEAISTSEARLNVPTKNSGREFFLLKNEQLLAKHLSKFYKSNKMINSVLGSTTSGESKTYSTGVSLAAWLRVVFDVPQQAHTDAEIHAKKLGSEKIAFAELLKIKEYLDRDATPSSKPDDFPSIVTYQAWKTAKMQLTESLIKVHQLQNPVLRSAQAAPQLYLPDDPREYFKTLVAKCLVHDINSYPNEKIGLSKTSKLLVNECALRWCISEDYKKIAQLEILVESYSAKEIELKDIFESFMEIAKSLGDPQTFNVLDCSIYLTLMNTLRKQLLQEFELFPNRLRIKGSKPEDSAKWLYGVTELLGRIHADPAWLTAHPEKRNPNVLKSEIEDIICTVLNKEYQVMAADIEKKEDDLDRQSAYAEQISATLSAYAWHFPDPIMETLSLRNLACRIWSNYFLCDMESMFLGGGRDGTMAQRYIQGSTFSLNIILDLYKDVKALKENCQTAGLTDMVERFQLERWFLPFIEKWLSVTDEKWIEWVRNSVAIETYTPLTPPNCMNSTSVTDLFSCFHGGLGFISQLEWKDEKRKEILIKNFIRMMSKTLEVYRAMMLQEFQDLERRANDKGSDVASLEFSTSSFIKVNNIFACLTKLEEVLSLLKVKEFAQDDAGFDAAKHVAPDVPKYTITVVSAYNLQICDVTTSDPYVVINIGDKKLKTRIIEKTLNPAWNETFELTLPGVSPLLDVIVYDYDWPGKDDVCGTGVLDLSAGTYDDFLTHDVTCPLKPQGRLTLRVRKEGIVDDVAWFVCKATEVIRFGLEDMLRIYVEQVARVARALLGDMSKPQTSQNFFMKRSATKYTTEDEVEDGMVELFRYLDTMLGNINEFLDPAMTRFLYQRYPLLMNIGQDATFLDLQSIPADSALTINAHKPHMMVKVIWQELVKLLTTEVNAFGTQGEGAKQLKAKTIKMGGSIKLTGEEREALYIYSVALELIKSFFYCNVNGTRMGFKLEELEDSRYIKLRKLMDNSLAARD